MFICSLMSFSQTINDSDTKKPLEGNFINNSSEKSLTKIDSVKVTDNNQKKSKIHEYWTKASFAELGFGGYSFKSELLNKNGVFGQVSLVPLSMGTSSLGGLGFGTKFFEYFGLQDIVEISTIAPIYIYFPIYISKKHETNGGSIPSMVNLYAGGSLWCKDLNSSSSSPDDIMILQATEYFHIGINYMFYNYSFDDRPFGKGNFSLDCGMLFYETKGVTFKNSFHIGILYNFAGKVKKFKS